MQQQLYFWFEHLHIYSVQFRRSVVCASKKSFFLIPFPFHAVHIAVSLERWNIPLFLKIYIFCISRRKSASVLFLPLILQGFKKHICAFLFRYFKFGVFSVHVFLLSNGFCSDIYYPVLSDTCVFHFLHLQL